MASQKLFIDIVARDKATKSLNLLRGGLSKVRSAVFNLQNAFIGLGAGLVIRNLVNTGKELENLQVRLKFLLKDTNEGAKAFDNMVKFASKVPFSLEEIQSGSGILATVTDNADDLQQMLEITGNVAAVTGLDFRTAAEQIQRSFSAGIGAADLFREKGVRNMLGFKAGATVSIEETVAAFEKVFGKGGRFGKATDELAETFEGTLSMIGDKIFNFKKVLLEAGLFESLKKEFGALDEFLEENSKSIDTIAKEIGIALGFAVKKVADFVILLKDNMDKFAFIIKGLIAIKVVKLFLSLASAIGLAAKSMAKFSLASLMSVKGLKGLALMVGKGGALYLAFKGIDKLFEDIEKKYQTFSDTVKNSLPDARDLHKVYKGIAKEKEKVVELTNRERGIIKHQQEELQTTKRIFEDLNNTALENTLSKFKNIKRTIAEGLNSGISSFSNSLSRAIILGEDLGKSFKRMVADALVNTLALLIEVVIRMGIQKLLGIDLEKSENRRLNTEKNITKEKQKQVALQAILLAMGGGGGGGNGGLFGMFASGGAVPKGQPVVVGENGPELFVPNQTGQITQTARGTNHGAVNVNFSINAVDAAGVDKLLIERRGTISRIINESVNERGRGAII